MWHDAQVIVLAAGSGSRLTSVGIRPKCLLPVGNFPMIYYPLKFIQENGYREATIIVNQDSEEEIKKLPEVYDLELRLDLISVDTSEDPGTAESLKAIEHKIKRDAHEIVILSGDLITDVSFSKMMHYHLSLGSALTILTAPQLKELTKAKPPGPKSKANLGTDLLGIDEESNRLFYSVSEGDYDDAIELRDKLSSMANTGIEVKTDIPDGHLYIMKRWLVDYILHKESPCLEMGSLKAEVIPHIVACQFQDDVSNENQISIHKFIKKGKFDDLIRMYNVSTIKSRFHADAAPKGFECYTYHHRNFCVRINTLENLWYINRNVIYLRELLKMNIPKYIKGGEISEKAQICDETVIGRSTQIAEKTSVTNSILGNHCRIGSLVRISNCLLFDYVQVESGCVIDSSIICVNVEKKCVIKNCTLTDVSKIKENKIYENELLEKGLSQDFS